MIMCVNEQNRKMYIYFDWTFFKFRAVFQFEGNQICSKAVGSDFADFRTQFVDDERAFGFVRIQVKHIFNHFRFFYKQRRTNELEAVVHLTWFAIILWRSIFSCFFFLLINRAATKWASGPSSSLWHGSDPTLARWSAHGSAATKPSSKKSSWYESIRRRNLLNYSQFPPLHSPPQSFCFSSVNYQ